MISLQFCKVYNIKYSCFNVWFVSPNCFIFSFLQVSLCSQNLGDNEKVGPDVGFQSFADLKRRPRRTRHCSKFMTRSHFDRELARRVFRQEQRRVKKRFHENVWMV